MQLNTTGKLFPMAALFAGVFISVVTMSFFLEEASKINETSVSKSYQPVVFLSTSTIPLRVSGVVRAAESTIVYAQTAGEVTRLPAREGMERSVGTLLVEQSTPVAEAKMNLAAAERGLGDLQQALNVEEAMGREAQAALRTYSAIEIASLRTIGNDKRVTEVSDSLQTALEQSVVTIIEAVNYVNKNRAQFSAEGLRVYESVVNELYGSVPKYFQGGITHPVRSASDIQTLLADIQLTSTPTIVALEEVAALIQGQLQALEYLFTTAEQDLFDRQSVLATDDNQTLYLTKRTKVLAAKQSLQATLAQFEQTVDRVLEAAVSLETNVSVTNIDKGLATTQAEYIKQIAAQADVVAAAAERVAAAVESLGSIRAPFTGMVSKVFVKRGEYVLPGAPLLSLVGSGARELVVTVPADIMTGVVPGQTLLVDDVVIGFVDRFSLVTEGGSGTIIINLLSEGVPGVGSSVVGLLNIIPSTEIYLVPRTHLHFDAGGPFIKYQDGAESQVEVVYDTGTEVFVRVKDVKTVALQAAASISL